MTQTSKSLKPEPILNSKSQEAKKQINSDSNITINDIQSNIIQKKFSKYFLLYVLYNFI